MANGDAAIAVGMDTVAGTADLRQGYDEINKTRDYLANHQTSGTHPASAINSGVLDAARIPNLPGSKITSEVSLPGTSIFVNATVTGTAIANNATLGNTTSTDCTVSGPLRNPAAVAYNITGTRRALWIEDATGRLGYTSSTRAVKQDIEPAVMSAESLMKLQIVTYRYIAAVSEHGDAAAVEIGLIAEDVAKLGFDWLVIRGPKGKPEGIHYDLLALAALAAAQHAMRQHAELAERVSKLEKGAR